MKNSLLIMAGLLISPMVMAGQNCQVIFKNNSTTQIELKTKHHFFKIPANGQISGRPNCDKLIAKKNSLMGTHSYAGYKLNINYSPDNQIVTYKLTGRPAPSVKCGTPMSIGANSVSVPC